MALLGDGCGESSGCKAGVVSGFRFFLFGLQIIMKMKISNPIKNQKYPKLLRKVCLMRNLHLCSDK